MLPQWAHQIPHKIMSIFGRGWNDALSSERNQIVFENRNKAYGAYYLREIYSENMTKALLLGVFLFCFALAGPFIKTLLDKVTEDKAPPAVLNYTELPPPPSIEEVPPPPKVNTPPPPPIKQIKFIPPVVTTKEDDPEVIDQIDDKPLPVVNNDPTPYVGGVDNTPAPIAVKEPDPEPVKIEEPKPEPEKVFTFAQVMPQFPGGQEELKKYLAKNIVYPRMAQENGIDGTVVVNFTVGKDGTISDIKIAKPINKDLDKEAIRVVTCMPNWKPGNNNGNPVKVSFMLPIKFTIQ